MTHEVDRPAEDASLDDARLLGAQLDDGLFAQIGLDLQAKGYSVNLAALPASLGSCLLKHLRGISDEEFVRAGIGRHLQLMQNDDVRTDQICWITAGSAAGDEWLCWVEKMQRSLNRQLFLGLYSFESHFAHYAVGAFYERHSDAFRGQANRVLSLVVYLNEDWREGDGGELVLFNGIDDSAGTQVTPSFGTLVVFLSEDFPHQVRVSHRDRYSVAGWFRLRTP